MNNMLRLMRQSSVQRTLTLQAKPVGHFYVVPRAFFSQSEKFEYIKIYEKEEDWQEVMERKGKPTLVQAGASWCGPCNMIKPLILGAVKEQKGAVEYLYVDIDEAQDLAQMLGIQSIPQVYMVNDGQLVGEMKGMPKDADAQIGDLIKKGLDAGSSE